MKYWIIYVISTGAIYGAPYLGFAEKWTNVPEGCAVIGPIPATDETAADAFIKPNKYQIIDHVLSVRPDYVEPTPQPTPKTPEQKKFDQLEAQLAQQNSDVTAFMDFYFESIGE